MTFGKKNGKKTRNEIVSVMSYIIEDRPKDEKPRPEQPEQEELILRHYTAKGTGPASVDAWSIPQSHYVAPEKAKRGATLHPRKGADR